MNRNDASKMRELFAQWRESGKSKAAFAALHQVAIPTFYYWSKKFESEVIPATSGFERLPVPVTVGATPMTVLRYPSGAQVEFYTAVGADYLKSLLN